MKDSFFQSKPTIIGLIDNNNVLYIDEHWIEDLIQKGVRKLINWIECERGEKFQYE